MWRTFPEDLPRAICKRVTDSKMARLPGSPLFRDDEKFLGQTRPSLWHTTKDRLDTKPFLYYFNIRYLVIHTKTLI